MNSFPLKVQYFYAWFGLNETCLKSSRLNRANYSVYIINIFLMILRKKIHVFEKNYVPNPTISAQKKTPESSDVLYLNDYLMMIRISRSLNG